LTKIEAKEMEASKVAHTSKKWQLWGYLAFSHGWTWSFWLIATLWGTTIWQPPALYFFLIGGMGVLVGGIMMNHLMYSSLGLRDLARRILDPSRVAGRWWAVILLFFPALTLLAGSVAGALGSSSSLDFSHTLTLVTNPLSLVGLMAFTLIIGPLPEEVGWRGYFLDRMQTRFSALPASLIVGFLHWSWHLPLFLLPGYWAAFGTTPPSPLNLAFVVLPATVLYVWVYNNTGRSVLATILFHFTGNFSGQFFGISEIATTYRLVLALVAVVFIVWRWGPKTLRRDRQSQTSLAFNMNRLSSGEKT
jgi:membrane protease YdiL (CAAX protease family)